MAPIDENIHPTASGRALDTVNAHSNPTGDADGLVLYAGWFCPFVQRVWIALEEKGVPYQYKEEQPYRKDPDFLKISPRGLVPAFKYRNQPLHESLVMLYFLEDAYPDRAPLLPKDAYGRALVALAIDHISKAVVPAFYRLLQRQDEKGQEEARTGSVASPAVAAAEEGAGWMDAMTSRASYRATVSEGSKYEEVYGRYLRDETQSAVGRATRTGSDLP